MKKTIKGIILAGGKGTRMRPHTETIPKPMLEVAGKPILHWLVDQLAKAGVRDIVLMENYLSHVVRDYFADKTDFDASITHLMDAQPNFGTADLVKRAVLYGDTSTDDVIIMAADTLIDVDYRQVMKYHAEKGGLVTVIGKREKLPHGMFVANVDGRITEVSEKPTVIISTATMIVNKEVFDSIDIHGDFFLNITPYIEKAGYLYEVDYERAMHVSEKRDDLLLVNERWSERMGVK